MFTGETHAIHVVRHRHHAVHFGVIIFQLLGTVVPALKNCRRKARLDIRRFRNIPTTPQSDCTNHPRCFLMGFMSSQHMIYPHYDGALTFFMGIAGLT